MALISLAGTWNCTYEKDGQSITAPISLPGTLDESGIGQPDLYAAPWHPDAHIQEALADAHCITTRFTRKYTYEGPVQIEKRIHVEVPEGKRVFLDVERARHLRLFINHEEIVPVSPPSISSPYHFEITHALTGDDLVTFIADNSYPTWPHDAIVFSSAATDETQTNWNGLLGSFQLRTEDALFISAVHVYPYKDHLDVNVQIDSTVSQSATLSLQSAVLTEEHSQTVSVHPGLQVVSFHGLPIQENATCWDLGQGVLHTMLARIGCLEPKSALFGLRTFVAEDGHFTLNGRRVFLRSEANCCVFPETGHAPMDTESWMEILRTYQSYGVNCMRFHSHVPPEAAFEAADYLGMLMQPELSHWNPRTAFEDDTSLHYYTSELLGVLESLANHPSFVMLTFGNELCCGEVGHQRMADLIALAHKTDPTRLFASASNGEYGANGPDSVSDFYTSQSFHSLPLRASFAGMHGHVNESLPGSMHDYAQGMQALRKDRSIPVVSFEVGQYEVLPDFSELTQFQGVTKPDNLAHVQSRAQALGLLETWADDVAVTGEIALQCYREEVEAALRTEELSGISLLGLQDFPGQGTALVGMLNSHLTPKPFAFASPSRFQAFFRDVLPLARMEKYAYSAQEVLSVTFQLANYGKEDRTGKLLYRLKGDDFNTSGTLSESHAPCGQVTQLGSVELPLSGITKPQKLHLHIAYAEYENIYPIWVYPLCTPVCPDDVYECSSLDDKAIARLREGWKVYLSPPATEEALPQSIRTQFSTDFWSVGTFPQQSGSMGQKIDASHPLFQDFPTETYSTWQWWPMASTRAFILPRPMSSIIRELDSYAFLRPMAKLLECKCLNGSLMLSSMGLQDLQQHPQARWLLQSLYRYMASSAFAPQQELTLEEVKALVP